MELKARILHNDMHLISVKVSVLGMQPASKGSYRAVNRRSKHDPSRIVSALVPMDKHEKPWRKAICEAVAQLQRVPQMTRNMCAATDESYFLLRPETVTMDKRLFPNRKPDIDKLIRATHDGLTDSGLIVDDSIICMTSATKEYVSTTEQCGLEMIINAYPNIPT